MKSSGPARRYGYRYTSLWKANVFPAYEAGYDERNASSFAERHGVEALRAEQSQCK